MSNVNAFPYNRTQDFKLELPDHKVGLALLYGVPQLHVGLSIFSNIRECRCFDASCTLHFAIASVFLVRNLPSS